MIQLADYRDEKENRLEKAARYFEKTNDGFVDKIEEDIYTPNYLRYLKGFGLPLVGAILGYIASGGSYRAANISSGVLSLGLCCLTGSKESHRTLLGYRIAMGVALPSVFSCMSD